jgi:hypothetical protein
MVFCAGLLVKRLLAPLDAIGAWIVSPSLDNYLNELFPSPE